MRMSGIIACPLVTDKALLRSGAPGPARLSWASTEPLECVGRRPARTPSISGCVAATPSCWNRWGCGCIGPDRLSPARCVGRIARSLRLATQCVANRGWRQSRDADQYVVIGGTAATLAMEGTSLESRATKGVHRRKGRVERRSGGEWRQQQLVESAHGNEPAERVEFGRVLRIQGARCRQQNSKRQKEDERPETNRERASHRLTKHGFDRHHAPSVPLDRPRPSERAWDGVQRHLTGVGCTPIGAV
jgi:hypothetical protein